MLFYQSDLKIITVMNVLREVNFLHCNWLDRMVVHGMIFINIMEGLAWKQQEQDIYIS
jgi:hypothetical protein